MSTARTRYVPIRRCVVCRSSMPQVELIRFARDEEGIWRLDEERRAGGRGVWVCKQERCHERKALGRAFRSQAEQVAEQLAGRRAPSREASQETSAGRRD